jgi:hypothetical protein
MEGLHRGPPFAKNGNAFAHEWSARDERYDQDETQKKLDERKKHQTGASLCTQFHGECGADSRERCEACPHWEQIRSPLGYLTSEQQEQAVVEERKTKNAKRLAEALAAIPTLMALIAGEDEGEIHPLS